MGDIATLSELSTAKRSEWISRLFVRLGAMYGKHFADMWTGQRLEDVKAIWADELADMTQDEVARGVASCRTRNWPPTLPEFIKLCRPALDYERAFAEAVQQLQRRKTGEDEWSNPAVYWASVSVGTHDMTGMSYPALRARWAEAMDKAVDRIRKGELPATVPERLEELPAPGKTTISKEEAQRRMAEVRKQLGAAMRSSTAEPRQ